MRQSTTASQMKGIRYVVDNSGKRKAVLIDLAKYGELWEDFYDSIVAKIRETEPRESLRSVKRRLRQQGKLNG